MYDACLLACIYDSRILILMHVYTILYPHVFMYDAYILVPDVRGRDAHIYDA